MLLSVYDSLDYTNQYYEHLLNNNEINTSVKQQLLKNYPFLRKSFVYSIVDELKTINSKMRQYFEMKRNLLRSNEFNRRNYKTNPYLSALKKNANFKKRPIIFKKLNYTFPIDYKVFEPEQVLPVAHESINKTELFNTLEKININYDKLYTPFQSKVIIKLRYIHCA